MQRRTILRRTGALGAIALAGCLGEGGPGAGSDPTTSPPPTDDPTTTVDDSSISTVDTGCRDDDGPDATVSFDTDGSMVTVSGTLATSTPCYEATLAAVSYDEESDTLAVDVAPEATDAEGCVQCLGAVEYEATVSITGPLPGTVAVTHDGDEITIGTPGDGEESGETGGRDDEPSIRESAFEITGRGPGEEHGDVDIEFDAEANAVVVTGTITGSDGCKTAALEDASYDADEDSLSVAVVTKDEEGSEDKACTEALVGIEYEATIRFAGGLPKSASVSHDGDGIASAAHGSASASEPPRTDG